MLDDYFKTAATPVRLRASLVGPYLDAFTEHLAGHGYAWFTVRQYIGGPVHLARWMEREHIAVVELDEHVLDRFREHLRRCRCRVKHNGSKAMRGPKALDGCLRFLESLRAAGIARPPEVPELPPEIRAFEEWMRAHRGTAQRTLADYRRHLLVLLGDGLAVEDLDARHLRDHVVRHSQPHRAQALVMVRALRMFVRFLVAVGRCDAHLDRAVPTVAHWRLRSLPSYLPAKEIERVISACSRSTSIGRRDRAIILLLVRLGLRRSDVQTLTLDDIDWKRGRLRVAGKTRRTTWLPLPQEVGDALLSYLKRGRPRSHNERVFLRTVAPYRELSSSGIGRLTSTALARAHVSPQSSGTHLFRHTAATEMLRKGASLDEIGQVLRHVSRDTTMQYAKVDLRTLRAIVLPWPVST
jgi:site-specific recombinase XerD